MLNILKNLNLNTMDWKKLFRNMDWKKMLSYGRMAFQFVRPMLFRGGLKAFAFGNGNLLR